MTPQIVLASASPRRRELLTMLGLPFKVCIPQADEKLDDKLSVFKAIEEIAIQKAKSIINHFSNDVWIIGADTMVVLDGQVLGKPANAHEAFTMLKQLSGKQHEVITGIAVVGCKGKRFISAHERTRVTFGVLPEAWIRHYIDTNEPMDKAGAYGVQGIAGAYISHIDGCFYNVMGLPLFALRKMLIELKLLDE